MYIFYYSKVETKTAVLPIIDPLFGGNPCLTISGKAITKWSNDTGKLNAYINWAMYNICIYYRMFRKKICCIFFQELSVLWPANRSNFTIAFCWELWKSLAAALWRLGLGWNGLGESTILIEQSE